MARVGSFPKSENVPATSSVPRRGSGAPGPHSAGKRENLSPFDELHHAILRGVSAQLILARVVQLASQETSARFVAVAPTSPHGRMDDKAVFLAFAGPAEAASLLQESPVAEQWQKALEDGCTTVVSVDSAGAAARDSFRAHSISYFLAVPLEVRGEMLGVLLVGFSSEADFDEASRSLQPCVTLAAAALWQERLREEGSQLSASYGALLELSAEPVLVMNRDGLIQEASRVLREKTGLGTHELGKMHLEGLFAPGSRDTVAAWRRSLGELSPLPLDALLRSGARVRLHLHHPVSSKGWLLNLEELSGAPAAAGNDARDSDPEAALLAVLDSVDNAVLIFDVPGRLRFASSRFVQMMGIDAHVLAGIPDFDSLVAFLQSHFGLPEAFSQRWQEIHRRGEEAAWDELELTHPAHRVLERFTRPIFSASGRRVGWLDLYRDITSDRLSEARLLQTEKMAALGQLVSGVAHELNNPLTSIMGYAQLLLGRRTDRSGRLNRQADARKIFQEARRASAIVRNLLHFSRDAKPERVAVDLNEIVERTLALRTYGLRLQNISLDLDLDPALPSTLADPHQLQQVVLNLLMNAEQAIEETHGPGRIRIRTRQPVPGRLALEVSDDGPGISPEIASRIFEPFFTTKPAGVGTGLGLSIISGIVQDHGGEIMLAQHSGRGATFVVELPAMAGRSVPARRTGEAAGPRESAEAAELRGCRVLVVEDEPTVAQLIADVLEDEGHHVEAVTESHAGLDRILNGAAPVYDLVICDLKMPRLDGRAFYGALVRASNPARNRILFVTGDTLGRRSLEFLEKNHLPFLAKPFLVEELKEAVNRCFKGNGRN